jgi:hypothetical protein
MYLLTPIALGLLALAVPIILLYVLKLRRQERIVPSTFLWRKALEDVQANAPWQRLRFNILLLLQLLALAALVLALAGPAYSRSHVVLGDLVLIVDESYGMQAHDVAPSRFAVAVQRAHSLAADLGGGHVVSVIGMGAQPHLAIAESSDQGAIGRAIDSLRAGVDQPNFLEALSLAASLARAGQSTQVIVLTSRDSGIATLPLTVGFPVDIERIGTRLHDLGITAFSSGLPSGASSSSAAQAPASRVQAVARVANFGAQTARSDVELFADNPLTGFKLQLVDVRPLTVPAHGQQNLAWTDLPSGVRRLEVRLTQSDDVAGDKTAWAAVAAEPTRRVLLVSRGDYFLQTALLLGPSVKLATVPPAAYIPGMERGFDLAVFDGVLPPYIPGGSTLMVAPPAGRAGALSFGREQTAGAVTNASSAVTGPAGAILRYADLSDVHVAQVRAVSLPGWLQPLAMSSGHAALAVGEKGNARYGIVNFDLQRSDWPLRISFPIVVQNMLRYLTPGLTLGARNIVSGQSVKFFPSPGTRRLDVTLPDGTVDHLSAPFPPFTDTAQPGLYSVKEVRAGTTAEAEPFAVNFFPARPAPASGPPSVRLGQDQASKAVRGSVPVEITGAVVIAALALLALEWWVAFRGGRWLGLGRRAS